MDTEMKSQGSRGLLGSYKYNGSPFTTLFLLQHHLKSTLFGFVLLPHNCFKL